MGLIGFLAIALLIKTIVGVIVKEKNKRDE